MKLWFDYHRKFVGIDFFVLYNVTSVNDALMSALAQYQKEGALEVVNMGDIASFNFHLYGQVILVTQNHPLTSCQRINSTGKRFPAGYCSQ